MHYLEEEALVVLIKSLPELTKSLKEININLELIQETLAEKEQKGG